MIITMNTNGYNYQSPPYQQPAPPPAPQPVRRETKNKLLTFLCACVPGAGQMYHGLLKRGLSLMVLFWGVIFLAATTYLTVILFLLPVIWFYSFFDTVNRMNMPVDEMRTLKDDYLFFNESFRSAAGKWEESSLFRRAFQERHLIIGWLLIILAGWILLNTLFVSWMGAGFWTAFMPERLYYAIRELIQTVPALVVPCFCLIIGVKLITGDRRGKKNALPPETQAQ